MKYYVNGAVTKGNSIGDAIKMFKASNPNTIIRSVVRKP